MTIGLAIPSIPPRANMLARALRSVHAQILKPDVTMVAYDEHHEGAAATRNRAWRALGEVEWVAFLDDDDELYPQHLDRLLATATETGADMVYPWFDVIGGTDPFPEAFGRPWDPDNPVQTTITTLWRREALESVRGFPGPNGGLDPKGHRRGEDMEAVLALNAMGGKIVHLAERTWAWRHDSGNTSGLPDRW